MGQDLQDQQYRDAAAAYGPAVDRLARAYEADADQRRDLVQDIHVALWRSFAAFDGRCSMRTWVYRVAHNAATSHVLKARRFRLDGLAGLEEIADAPDAADNPEQAVGEKQALDRLMALVRRLRPADRQIVLLYLEDFDTAAISEVTGLKGGAVGAKIHRLKALLARQFHEGDRHD
jgi:RNA polymerase sigma-70 factor (ECF subfamily)